MTVRVCDPRARWLWGAARVAVSVVVLVVPGGWVAAGPGGPKTKYEYEAPRQNMNTKRFVYLKSGSAQKTPTRLNMNTKPQTLI